LWCWHRKPLKFACPLFQWPEVLATYSRSSGYAQIQIRCQHFQVCKPIYN
jgi:hypothetical protein